MKKTGIGICAFLARQMPAEMLTAESLQEDLPHDMKQYHD